MQRFDGCAQAPVAFARSCLAANAGDKRLPLKTSIAATAAIVAIIL
jgi:hypothetical protein